MVYGEIGRFPVEIVETNAKYTGLTTFVLEQTLIHFYSYVSDHSK
jgi:hypothetical protein